MYNKYMFLMSLLIGYLISAFIYSFLASYTNVFYKGKNIESKELTVPHPRAHLRNFVLFPIRELSPTWTHPILNKRIDYLIKF